MGYSMIEGLSFPKGSDKEYVEEWGCGLAVNSGPKTINGAWVLMKPALRTLTVRGSGEIKPGCKIQVGQEVPVRNDRLEHTCQMRLEKWQLTWISWEFRYVWSFTFSEVAL